MKKKFIVSLFVLVLLISLSMVLVACGERYSPSKDGDNNKYASFAGTYYRVTNSGDVDPYDWVKFNADGTYEDCDGISDKFVVKDNVIKLYYESSVVITGSFDQTNGIYLNIDGESVVYISSNNIPSYTITCDLNGGTISSSNVSQYNALTDTFTLINPTKEGYEFLGWTGSNGSTPQKTITISKGSSGDRIYAANWAPMSYTITYNLDGGNTSWSNPTKYNINTSTFTLTNPTKDGYEFEGWSGTDLNGYSKNVIVSKGSSGDRTYTANWKAISYFITYDLNGGEVSSSNPTKYNINTSTFTLTNPTKEGYEFEGWSGTEIDDKSTMLTIIKGSTGDRTYTANWKVIEYTVKLLETYATLTISYDTLGGSSIESDEYAYGEALEYPSIPTKSGCMFGGWYDNSSYNGDPFDFTKDLDSSITLYAKWLTPYSYASIWSIGSNGSIYITGSYKYYPIVSLTDQTITVYSSSSYDTYGGLFDSSKSSLITNDDGGNGNNFSFTYSIKAGILYYVGVKMWSSSSSANVTLCVNGTQLSPQAGGAVIGNSSFNYTVNDEDIPIANPTRNGYTFVGWTGSNGSTPQTTVTITKGSSGDRTYTANWETTTEQAYSRSGNSIEFGLYPQTKVTDSTLISTLDTKAGTLPTSSNSQSWTSYGYYINGSVSNYMWYIDIEEGGEKYRGVYFTQYRPYYTTYTSSTSNSNQDDNGYNTYTTYWFKYEPIKWTIVEEENGYATLVCDLAIDSQQFDYDGSYLNNYKESTIRKWLNETFYNTAFSALQKSIIQTTEVDNSASSTETSSNSYACENTNDKVYLLSYKEATTYYTSSTLRQKQSTDYAKAQGSYMDLGNCYWWLRSPSYNSSDYASGVNIYGYIIYDVSHTDCGVVPALKIKL